MTEKPIACNLGVFAPEQRQRHALLTQELAHAVQETHELVDGYAFRYALGQVTWLQVAEFVELERLCCPFFTFTLRYETNGVTWLQLTGAVGVKEFLASQL